MPDFKPPNDAEIIDRVRTVFFEPAAHMPLYAMTREQTRAFLQLIMMGEEQAAAAMADALEQRIYEATVARNVADRFTRAISAGILLRPIRSQQARLG